MSKIQTGSKGKLVWAGRPSVSVFYVLYGVIALVVIAVLVVLEYSLTTYMTSVPLCSRQYLCWRCYDSLPG